jgi:hypothetical protein
VLRVLAFLRTSIVVVIAVTVVVVVVDVELIVATFAPRWLFVDCKHWKAGL